MWALPWDAAWGEGSGKEGGALDGGAVDVRLRHHDPVSPLHVLHHARVSLSSCLLLLLLLLLLHGHT